MSDKLDAQVLASIEGYRKREKALEKIEELSRKDAWAVAMEIRLMVSRQARLWHRVCHERYGIDLQRWLVKDDPTDFSSLTQSRSSSEATAVVECILTHAFWECLQILMSAVEKAVTGQRADRDKAICAVYVSWLRWCPRPANWYQSYLNPLR